jgi:hypothetical protein
MSWKHYVVAAFGLVVACCGAWLPTSATFTDGAGYVTMVAGFAIVGAALAPRKRRRG